MNILPPIIIRLLENFRPLMLFEVFETFTLPLTGLLVGEAKHRTVRSKVFAPTDYQPARISDFFTTHRVSPQGLMAKLAELVLRLRCRNVATTRCSGGSPPPPCASSAASYMSKAKSERSKSMTPKFSWAACIKGAPSGRVIVVIVPGLKKRKPWYLVTTDLEFEAVAAVRAYASRAQVEVNFDEAKELWLGRYQGCPSSGVRRWAILVCLAQEREETIG